MTDDTLTLKIVRGTLLADSASVKANIFTVREGFFFTHGYTAEMLAERVLAAFPNVTILETGEVWKSFRGGASVAAQSHWFVKFTAKGNS